MKKYNQSNFSRYKQDVKASQPEGKFWDEYTREELITKFMPLVENISRKFPSGDAASGVLSLSDYLQEGNIGLIKAVDKITWPTILSSKDPSKTLKSFLSKRIRGAIRRAIDGKRTGMRIPEHKLNEIRKDFDNESNSALFYNSIFQSIDKMTDDENSYFFDVEDNAEDPLKKEKLYSYIRSVMLANLNEKEFQVLRLSFGLNCEKLSAKQIADKLEMKGSSSYVRVSQLKKQAIVKLKKVMNYSQVIDYL